MAISMRMTPIATTLNLIVARTLSPAAQSRAIAAFARGAIEEADEVNRRVLGRVPPRTVTVDGRVGASLDSVKPNGGSIVAEWELVGGVLQWIGDTLVSRSPAVSGNYKRAHTLFADGVEVPLGGEIPKADEYVFLNPLPYARKIEIGKTKSGRDFVIQVENRIYERTAKDAAAKFGNLASIKMTFRAPFNGAIVAYVPITRTVVRTKKGQFVGGFSKGNAAAAARERSLRVPAIVVRLRG